MSDSAPSTPAPSTPTPETPAPEPAALETSALSKSFGGVFAVREVSVAFAHGCVNAIIGPNGAGKTTLINLLSGDLKPSSGRIVYGGRDITALPPHRVSQLGIGRSYQITNIFPPFTVGRNVWLAAQSRLPSSLRFFRPAVRRRDVAERAERALVAAGLADSVDRIAGTISHGEQRQLEIAMLLATEPQVLLLDEPLAGMGPEEGVGIVRLIQGLRGDHCVVLIEHDMDAVFAVADRLTVMVGGAVLETGTPASIRASDTVRKAYLGDALDGAPQGATA
ncbi:MAG: ABC transporter ATP-binding protein [Rhodospirillales bacterium]|nr:ABC transporter ATP-binding protein [Rhodospirillales bacterium]